MVDDEQRWRASLDAAMRRKRELKAAKENGAPPPSPYKLNMSEAQRAIMRIAEKLKEI